MHNAIDKSEKIWYITDKLHSATKKGGDNMAETIYEVLGMAAQDPADGGIGGREKTFAGAVGVAEWTCAERMRTLRGPPRQAEFCIQKNYKEEI